MVKSPLKIRDYSIQAKNTRKELMEKIPEEMKGKKKFVFNKFVTDRERVVNFIINYLDCLLRRTKEKS